MIGLKIKGRQVIQPWNVERGLTKRLEIDPPVILIMDIISMHRRTVDLKEQSRQDHNLTS